MAEFHKKQEEKESHANEWLDQFKPNLESTIHRTEKFQERRLFSLEIIALVFVGAFFVSTLSSCIFDLLVSFTETLNLQRLIIDIGFFSISLEIIIIVFLYFRKELNKYQPQTPVLTLIVRPEDIKPFIDQKRYDDIIKFMYDGKLKDFKTFATSVFHRLTADFYFLFGIQKAELIKEYEDNPEFGGMLDNSGLVTLARDYDISKMSTTGVEVTLQIVLRPKTTYYIGVDGNKTASYSFALSFHLIVKNPQHCDADKLIEEYYLFKANQLVEFSSHAINWSFRQIGLEFDWEKKAKERLSQSSQKV